MGAVCLITLAACGESATRPPTSPPPAAILIAGLVTDRLTRTPIEGSTITFTGVSTHSAGVSGGRFELEMPPGQYAVSIEGPSHVPHRTEIAYVNGSVELRFSVLGWGPTLFGATYDQTFHQAFHQIARINAGGDTGIRKWTVLPSEIYLVEGMVPDEHFRAVREVLEEIARDSIPALWCGTAGSIAVTSGPNTNQSDGRIVVRPNWGTTTTGTLERGAIRSGTVQIQVFIPSLNRPVTRDEFRGALLHELYHVAFGYHLCGGDLGTNPFGFSQANCPFPNSVMANRGPLIGTLSPQDRVAACIVYHQDTHVGNRFPDINERYTVQ